ncbi:O-antigen ligase family protein [Notoacmeibacter ruber]|uniref:O-antigen ligase-related domain-containing protein n=1 Tax=Notoacmeibacter ruber TaxID=2670375 RepID=A0A3L7JGF5_9HYPH|nr:O-antigen ligase family protein [Notoacmeibacter ruber]RLQ87562.1 hypothetical protein D8780_04415 [Notoacmeibacter ruber]
MKIFLNSSRLGSVGKERPSRMSDQSNNLVRPTAIAPSKLHALAVCFALASLPLLFSYLFWPGHGPLTNPGNEQLGIVLVLQLCVIILSGTVRTSPRRWGLDALFLLALVPLGVQGWHTILQADAGAVSSLVRWSVLVAFGAAIYIGIRNRHLALTNRTTAMTVVAAALGYVVLFTLVYSDQQEFERLGTVVLGFVNIRYTSHFVAPAIAILLAWAVRHPYLDRRYAVIVGLTAILSVFSFYTGSRGTLLSVAATVAVLVLFSPGFRLWRMLPTLLIVCVAGYGLAALLPPPDDTNFLFFSRLGRMDSGRIAIWLTLLEHWTRAPLLGYGEVNIGPIVGSFVAQAHNSIVQNLFSVGLVGSLAIWTLVAVLFWRMLQALREQDDRALPAIAGIACIFANSLLGGSLFAPYPLALCALMVATFLANQTGGDNLRSAKATAQTDHGPDLAFDPR